MKAVLGVLVGGVTIAVFAMSQYWRDATAEMPQFRTAQVTRGDLFIGVTATGTVEPVEIIDVGAQIIGSVKSFGADPDRPGKTVDFCSRVQSGDVLAQLDDLPYRAELAKAQVSLKLAEAELKHSRAKEKQTKLAYDRAKDLRDTEAEAEYEKSESEYQMAQADVAMAEAKVEQAKIAQTQADINLGYTSIHSPIDGVVIDRRVNVGQTVVAGMNAPSLFLLAKDLRRMLVWAAVNEADIGDIHVGQNVTFTVDAYNDREFSGKVSQIRLNASLQQNVVTYGVIVDVENTDGKLLPYMTAKLQFEVARRQNALLVSNQALRWKPTMSQISPAVREEVATRLATNPQQADIDDPESEAEPKVELNSPTVWVLANDGYVEPLAVEVGLSDGMITELIGGDLKPGDVVVTNDIPKEEPDFVSSFVTKVTGDNEE